MTYRSSKSVHRGMRPVRVTKRPKKKDKEKHTVTNWVFAVESKWNFEWSIVFGGVLSFEFQQIARGFRDVGLLVEIFPTLFLWSLAYYGRSME